MKKNNFKYFRGYCERVFVSIEWTWENNINAPHIPIESLNFGLIEFDRYFLDRNIGRNINLFR